MQKNSLKESKASLKPASDIFMVKGPAACAEGIGGLIALMGKQGLPFYQSKKSAATSGPRGLVGPGDTLIIKVNSQWAERGGTNTDVVKSLIPRASKDWKKR